jgi:hypothetical protein
MAASFTDPERTAGGEWNSLAVAHESQRMAQKRRRLESRPSSCLWLAWRSRLTFDYVNDLMGVRAKNDVLAAHQDEIVATPFRIDFHDT